MEKKLNSLENTHTWKFLKQFLSEVTLLFPLRKMSTYIVSQITEDSMYVMN